MFILVLGTNNIVPDGFNNKLIYKFPNSVVLTDKYIAVSSIAMFYSWNNITKLLNNNTLYYTWGGVQISIVIPDGLYEIAQLNEYIQFEMITNGTYWYAATAASTFLYPFSVAVNATRYAIQLNTFTIPVNEAVYTCGVGVYSNGTFPVGGGFSSVQFPPNFNKIVGYTVLPTGFASYTSSVQVPTVATASTNYATYNSGVISYLSNTAPQVQPNSNVFLSLSNINNPYSQPSSIIYSITPTVAIGEQIIERPPNFMWTKLIDGTYNELRATFLGNDLSQLAIGDPNMQILLVVRDKDESFLGSK